MSLLGNAGRWMVFAGLAIAMSWFLRLLAASAARAGSRRLGDARVALGLAREIPKRRTTSHKGTDERETAVDAASGRGEQEG